MRSCRKAIFSTTYAQTRSFKKIPFYDFQRYRKVYNNNKVLRFPTEMDVIYFVRPDSHDTDAEVLEHQLQQTTFPFSDIVKYLPDYIKTGVERFSSLSDIRTEDETMHGEATFLGFAKQNRTGKLERYLLKFFPTNPIQLKNMRREVLFSYLFVEAGEALHAPKITFDTIDGCSYIMRRFYKGTDGRMVLENDIPDDLISQLRPASLVKQYALRYVLLGDIDFHNPGNIIFTRHSDLTPKVLVHIDGEGILPDADCLTQFLDNDGSYEKGDPIPGSLAWREATSQMLGSEEFFTRSCGSDNIILAFLRQSCSVEEMAKIELSREFLGRVLPARPYFEQLVRTFDIHPLESLQNGIVDFQKTFDKWEECYKNNKSITLFNLVTGLY